MLAFYQIYQFLAPEQTIVSYRGGYPEDEGFAVNYQMGLLDTSP
ncbi:hypothetical protein MARINOS108_10294 [Marinoscillum sp. 108]|nr:hypothetical protein MARINOS108_10294 [Marinoscillum sp. 108]